MFTHHSGWIPSLCCVLFCIVLYSLHLLPGPINACCPFHLNESCTFNTLLFLKILTYPYVPHFNVLYLRNNIQGHFGFPIIFQLDFEDLIALSF